MSYLHNFLSIPLILFWVCLEKNPACGNLKKQLFRLLQDSLVLNWSVNNLQKLCQLIQVETNCFVIRRCIETDSCIFNFMINHYSDNSESLQQKYLEQMLF